jgi:hypothetical protein
MLSPLAAFALNVQGAWRPYDEQGSIKFKIRLPDAPANTSQQPINARQQIRHRRAHTMKGKSTNTTKSWTY